jgi:hypothetical protein
MTGDALILLVEGVHRAPRESDPISQLAGMLVGGRVPPSTCGAGAVRQQQALRQPLGGEEAADRAGTQWALLPGQSHDSSSLQLRSRSVQACWYRF